MIKLVTIKNEPEHPAEIAVFRRFPLTGNEALIVRLPVGRGYAGYVWKGCEIVIRALPPLAG